MRKPTWKRAFSFALALVLVLGYLPATAMTANAEETTTNTITTQAASFDDLTTDLGFKDFYGRTALSEFSNSTALLYAYDQIAVGIDRMDTEILFDDSPVALTKADFEMAWEAYAGDFAHHFWSEYYTLRFEGTTVVSMIPEYNMDSTAIPQARADFDSAVNAILSGVNSSWSDFEKELYIHDTLAKNVRYADGNYSHNAYGALVKGTAVCEGYAEALQYLLHKVGIQSYLVVGTADGAAHKWNLVRIGGQYYYVDLTWNDQATITYHAYFNITTAQIKEDHAFAATSISLPQCTATTYNYFAQKGGLLTTPYNVSAIAALIKKGKGQAHVFIPGDAEAFGTWYANNLEAIAEALGYTGTYYYGFNGIGREVVLILTTLNITQQPQHTAVAKGETATVTVLAKGTGLAYKWYYRNKDGKDFVLSTLCTTNKYSLEMNESRDGRQVYCVITDAHGNTITSDVVTINMLTNSTSGTCGEGVNWSFENGTLTISGNGYMDIGEIPPWYAYRTEMTAVVIEDGVKNISDYTLTACNKVTSVTLGKDVEILDNIVFSDCYSLKSITVSAENPYYANDTQGFLYAKDMTVLLYVPASIATINIPSGVTTVAHYALSDCAPFTIRIPKTVTYIGIQFFEYILLDCSIRYEGSSAEWQKVVIAEGRSYIDTRITCEGDKVNITSSPTDLTLEIGEKATLRVTATGAGLNYYWYIKPFNSNTWTETSVTTSTYPITMTAELSGAQFYCLVVNKNYDSQQTTPITVTMPDHADKAVITKQPARAKAYKDEIVTFSVTATGAGLTYQWYYKPYGGKFTLDPTQVSDTYTLVMDESMDGAEVYCVVTDKFGCSVKSNSAYLDIKNPLVLVHQPRDGTARLGESVIVTLTATGDSLKYRWYYANKGSDTFVESSSTGDYYSIAMTEARDGRRLYCVITDIYGKSVTTNTVTITKRKDDSFCGVNATWSLSSDGTLTISGTGPMYDFTTSSAPWSDRASSIKKIVVKDGITGIGSDAFKYAKAQTVSIPDSVTFIGASAFWCNRITAVILPKNLVTIDRSAFGYCDNLSTVVMYEKVTAIGDDAFEGSPLKDIYYTGTAEQWAKIFYKSYNNQKLHKATKHYNSTITKPAISQQPVSVTVGSGKTATVRVTATGIGLTYKWYYKNLGASSFSLSTTTTNTYSTQMNESRHGRQLYCVISDIYGNTVKSNTVTISMQQPPKITKQPANASAAMGSKVTTSLTATGEGLTYTWYFKNKGASSYSKSSLTGNEYYVTMKDTTSGRQVYCLITDKYGNSVKSNVVTLTSKVSITQQPTNAAAPKGQKVSTKLTATGEGLTYKWYYKNASASSYSKSSSTGSTYSATTKSAMNGRQVYCVITDKYGNSVKSNVVKLYMGNPAKITKQPANVAAANSQKATTQLTATGDGLKYVWYFKNAGSSTWSKSSLTGNSYYVTMKNTTSGRQVYCVVTDKYGISVKSNVVTLTMASSLTITKQPTNASAPIGNRVSVTVEASGEGLTYTWYIQNVGQSTWGKSSLTGNEYYVTMKETVSGRKVYCVITDKYGVSVKTDVVTLTVSGSAQTPLTITKQPTDVSAPIGSRVSTTVEATGEGLTYTWYIQNAGQTTWGKSSLTGNEYYVTMKETVSGRKVYCVITDKYGVSVTTDTVTLTAE